MKLEFNEDKALVIVPENTVEMMALKYWEMEYREHGDKMLTVVTTLPIRLHSPQS